MDGFDVNDWMDSLRGKLMAAFGDRLALVGVQGSRARNEARETSDIDAVIVIEGLTKDDLATCRKVVSSMAHSGLVCGFVGSPETLAFWPRHDVFNLVNDTRVVYGSFDFMDTGFTSDDAVLSAKVVASEVRHAVCHAIAFEPEALTPTTEACVKSAFFAMRALTFAATGEYPESRARMLELSGPEERFLLHAYEGFQEADVDEVSEALLKWSEGVLLGQFCAASEARA